MKATTSNTIFNKLPPAALSVKNSDINIFGDWIDNVEKLHKQFISSKPFPHIILNNFIISIDNILNL